MKPTWAGLRPGRFSASASEPEIDPLFVWADATDFRDHFPHPPRADSPVRFVIARAAQHGKVRFESLEMAPAALKDQGSSFLRVELAEPVVPERPASLAEPPPALAEADLPTSEAEVLIGIIDSGCPFAAQMLRNEEGTRLLALWDQDDAPAFAHVGGIRPKGVGYGCAIYRDQLDALMKKATDATTGSIDEERCYRLAGYDVMREAFSHGAAVMGQLFDPPDYRRCLQGELEEPVGATADTHLIDKADIVFVQLPRAAVQDSTSAALSRYLIDGLRFIVAQAQKGKTKRIVVNISSGTSRTPHDGTSLLERAMVAFVDDAKTSGIELWIVVPMGNTNLEQRHAVLSEGGKSLRLFLPPDCEMPQYVTVRWPKESEAVDLKVTPPAEEESGEVGTGEAKGWPSASRPQCGVVSPVPGSDGARRSLIAFTPTTSDDPARPVARSGMWTLELVGTPAGTVHFWISRNQRNPGAQPRSRQASFVDVDEDRDRDGLPRCLRRAYDDKITVSNGIQRDSAFSGLASAAAGPGHGGRIVAVGAYVVADGAQATCYSAAGVSSTEEQLTLKGPDYSAGGDVSWSLPGLPVRGNRSGTIMRAVGTSFSAPLVARWLANEPLQKPPGTKHSGSSARPLQPPPAIKEGLGKKR